MTVNSPDKIVFVGEALAGNEAVDQVTKFNRSLRDFSGGNNARGIDGMILTKHVAPASSGSTDWAQIRHDRRQGGSRAVDDLRDGTADPVRGHGPDVLGPQVAARAAHRVRPAELKLRVVHPHRSALSSSGPMPNKKRSGASRRAS